MVAWLGTWPGVWLAAPLIAWDTVLVPPLHFLIYGILAPLVFAAILAADLELAWPGSLHLRHALARAGFQRVGDPPRFATEPGFRVRCVVGALVAVAMWCLAMTLWLAGYLRGMVGPSLDASRASPRIVLIFVFTLILGGACGYEWVARMRQARDAAASLAVIAVSMSLTGTILFFYIVEAGLRDWFLALALGVVLGELAAAAHQPGLLLEGLFAVLFIAPPLPPEPIEADFPPIDTVDADAWHAGEVPPGGWGEGSEQDVWQPQAGYPTQNPRALIGVGSSSEPASEERGERRADEGHPAGGDETPGQRAQHS